MTKRIAACTTGDNQLMIYETEITARRGRRALQDAAMQKNAEQLVAATQANKQKTWGRFICLWLPVGGLGLFILVYIKRASRQIQGKNSHFTTKWVKM